MQIDQNSTTSINAKLAKGLTEGKFYVLLGGDGNLYESAMYEISDGGTPKMVLVGDVDGNGKVELNDYSQIGKYLVHKTSVIVEGEDSYYAAAYADGKKALELNDYSQIGKYLVHKICCELINTEVAISSIEE